jgi:hypothetical protein
MTSRHTDGKKAEERLQRAADRLRRAQEEKLHAMLEYLAARDALRTLRLDTAEETLAARETTPWS